MGKGQGRTEMPEQMRILGLYSVSFKIIIGATINAEICSTTVTMHAI